jgi:hypothetical protein
MYISYSRPLKGGNATTILTVFPHGQLRNGDVYWQASVLNCDITSRGREDVEGENGAVTSFQTGHIDAATVGSPPSS